MLHASTQKLIIKLCELTALGDIQWREGRDGAVVFETEGYAVEIEGQPAKLRVLNSDGNALEQVDTDVLAAASWPSGDGSFADHVATMATQAKRLARGTDHAISRILSSLSAPSVASAAKIEAPEEHPLSTAGGPESEASMAAAVADMAIRLNQTPPEEPSEIPPPVIEVAEITPMATIAETSQAELATEAAPTETVVEATPEPAAETEPTPPLRAPVEHFKRSAETFGRTRSFAIAGRTHHRPSPEARPVSSLGKITASGLIVPGRSGAAQQELETPPPAPEPIVSSPPQPEDLKTATVKPMPAPTSPDAYKPWV